MMNLHVDKIHNVVKMNIPLTTDNKKGKQVSFSHQFLSQATPNQRNQVALSSLPHNMNHIHIDNEAEETVLAISSLVSGKDLSDL